MNLGRAPVFDRLNRLVLVCFLALGFASTHIVPTEAGLLSILAKAGKGASVGKGAGAAKLGVGVLAADATGLIKVLPDADNVSRFAVQSGPDGFRLAGKGEVDFARYADGDALDARLTQLKAANPDETIEIYVDDYAYARIRKVFDDASRSGKADVKVLVNKREVATLSQGGRLLEFENGLKVVNRPGIELRQVTYRMNAPLVGDQVRLLRLADDASPLPTVREKIYGSKPLAPEPEAIATTNLTEQFRRVRGQTLVLTGKVDGQNLIYRTESGEKSILLRDIRNAGADADVNLILVDTGKAAQPTGSGVLRSGGYKPLADALDAPTYGEFLRRLSPDDRGFIVDADRNGSGHMAFSLRPAPVAQTVSNRGSAALEAAALAGDVVRLSLLLRDSETESEWSNRWFTERLSAGWNLLIALNLIFGLLAIRTFWRISRAALRRMLPVTLNRWLHRLATLVVALAMIPFVGAIIGIPMLIWGYVLAIWNILSWPFRALFRKTAPA